MKRFQILLAAAVVVSLTACGGETQTATTVESRVLTKSTPAVAAQVNLLEEFTSEIEPYHENDITPAAAGVHIDRIHVEVGDRVVKGQLLVSLDPTQYTQQLVQLQNIEEDYNRLEPVYEAGGISKQQIDQARTQRDILREAVANLKKNIEVRSPIAGIITARNYESGDLFAQMPILHVMQIDPVKVIVNISEIYYQNVKVGMPVKLQLDIFPDRVFEGRVSLVYPALDPATRTFKVEIKVPNSASTLRPGMYARTIFDMGEKPGVMIPDVAVQKQMGTNERFIYVIVGDSIAERRTVEVGRTVDGQVDILSGVEVGEEVAVTAFSRLRDGVKVTLK